MSGIESQDLHQFTVELGRVGHQVAADVVAVVNKGALNIKQTMRSDLEKSIHFKAVARDVSYDIITEDDSITAEIGPVVGRGAGHAGGLGGIAYYGSSKGGGGKVRDPQEALDEEAPRFEEALKAVVDGVL